MDTMETKTGNKTWMGLARQNMTRAAMLLVMMLTCLTAGAQDLQGLELWLGETQLTVDNRGNILGDGKASYDPDTHTLTLNDPTITGTHEGCKIYVYFNSRYNLELDIKGSYHMAKAETDKGLFVYQGSSSWNRSSVTFDGNFTFFGEIYGIADLYGDITVKSGTLRATATGTSGGKTFGISCHDLTVESGVDLVELKGKVALLNNEDGKLTLAKEGKLTLVDGYVSVWVGLDLWLGSTKITVDNAGNILNQVDAGGNPTASFDPDTHTLTLNNPTITGTHEGCKIYVKFNSSNNLELDIKGSYHMTEAETNDGLGVYQSLSSWGRSSLTFDGDFTFFGESYGISDFDGDITVQSGTLTATATATSGGNTFGITCNDFTVQSGVDLIEMQGVVAMQCFTPTLPDGYEISNSGNYAVIKDKNNPYEPYALWVGGKVVSNRNKDDILGDGKASFDPATNTLTLDNPTIPGSTQSSKIYSKLPNLTVTGSYHMTEAETLSGIRSDGGSLTLDGDFTIMSAGYWFDFPDGRRLVSDGNPIWVTGDITLKGNINVKGKDIAFGGICTQNGNITMTSGRLYINSDMYGVYCENGTFTAEGSAQSICIEGKGGAVYAKNMVTSRQFIEPAGASFNATLMTVCDSNGMVPSRIVMGPPGSHFNLWLGSTPVFSSNKNDILGDGKASYNPDTNTLTLNNPSIDCTTTDYVIYCADKDLIVTGNYHMTQGTTENGIVVSNGNLTLDGDFTIMSKGNWQYDGSNSATIQNATLKCSGNITLNGNITVQGEGVPAAVLAKGDITVTGGNIQASAGYIGAYCSGKFTAKGSTESITLDGNGCALYASDFVIDNAEGELLKIYGPEGAQFDPAHKSVYGSDHNVAKHLVLHQPERYKLWLGDTQVHSDNRADILGDGKASYDPDTHTLTLDNPAISGQTSGAAIYSEHIDLKVAGSATVSTTASCGIKVMYGSLAFDGNFNFTGSEYAMWATNGLRLGQTIDITSPEGAKYNQIGKESTVYESDGNTVATSVTVQNLDKYKIWLGTTQVTSLNRDDILGDGTARYDADTRTLILQNPTISGTGSQSKIFAQNTDLTICGSYAMSAAESNFGLYISGGTLRLSGDLTFRGSSMGIVTDDNLYLRGHIRAYGDYAGIQAPKGITLEHGLTTTRVEMTGGTGGAYDGGPIQPAVTLVTPNGGTITNYDETTTRIYNYNGGPEATEAVLEYRYAGHGEGTQESPYLVKTTEDWTLLAQDIAGGIVTAGKYFELAGYATANTMLGTEDFPFSGVFNGKNRYALTAEIDNTSSGAAPFHTISGATIRNLFVKGSVRGHYYSSGLVGYAKGNGNVIENCEVSTSVVSSGDKNGGILGHAGSYATTIDGCVFRGAFAGTGGAYSVSAINNGTMVGWTESGATLTLTGCLDLSNIPDPIGRGEEAPQTCSNNYYTTAYEKNTGTDIWSAGAQRAYKATGLGVELMLTGTTGLTYGGDIYAAQGETVSFIVDPNYVAYTSTAGTFTQNVSSCTLVMPAENVTILDRNISSFDVAVTPGVNGQVRVNRTENRAGAAVYVATEPDDYYLLDKITVVDGNGEAYPVDEDGFFTMPNTNVTVTATFKKKYSYDATNGVLHLLCGDFSGGGSIHSWDPLEVSSAGVTSVIADKGVRFTGLCVGLFQNLKNCTEMDLHNVETSAMTDMRGMFSSCEKLQTLNMTGWNTANVTDMDNMFEACYLLTELDLSMFNTSAVTDFNEMFENCGVYKLTLPAGMAVTKDMELKNGKQYQENNNWKRSGWIILESDVTVVSGPESETYAAIAAPPIPMTFVWQWMPDDFVLELPDNQDNRDLIRTWHGVTTNVKLTGRTLYHDGDWNTLCLPFTLSNALDASYPALDGADFKSLDINGKYNEQGQAYFGGDEQDIADYTIQTGFDEATGTLNLFFKDGDFEAGTPLIAKWDSGEDIVSPVFSDVTINKTMYPAVSQDGKVTFVGQYSPIMVTEPNRYIMLSSGNTLGYAAAGNTLRPFRAHFEVTSGQNVKGYRISFGEENPSIIHNSQFIIHNNDDAWYSLDGIKLQGKPTRKGIYIHNGRRIVVK